MGLRINSNIPSLGAQRNLAKITEQLASHYRRLSTGLRIASAADDPAGLAMSERLRAQIRSLDQAGRNAQDGISLVSTAEGALDEVGSMLGRLRELAVQSANGTLSQADRDTLQQEFGELVSEIDRIAQGTEFNDINLLDGTGGTITFQVGGSTSVADGIGVQLGSARANDLGIQALDVSSVGGATSAIDAIDQAVDTVSSLRGRFGSAQNRLESTVNYLGVQRENLTAAESRIRDVDVAYETALLAKAQILQQATIAVLTQANAQPQLALRLLQL